MTGLSFDSHFIFPIYFDSQKNLILLSNQFNGLLFFLLLAILFLIKGKRDKNEVNGGKNELWQSWAVGCGKAGLWQVWVGRVRHKRICNEHLEEE